MVSDTGSAIPAERFDPLRPVRSRTDGGEGPGRGLALSKKLVELMGGEIGVESEVSRGSTFSMELPVAEKPDPPL